MHHLGVAEGRPDRPALERIARTVAPLIALVAVCLAALDDAAAQPRTVIPLDAPGDWQVLKYTNIKPHAVTFADCGMTVDVDASASPIIYPMKPRYVKALHSTLEINGDLDLKSAPQGAKGNDDFLLRIGLVYEGEKKLNYLQRAVAAKWVKTLFDLAPEGTGIDRIQFYNIYSDPALSGTARTHPDAEVIGEQFALEVAAREIERENGAMPLRFSITPEAERKVLALWISADGDDTRSKFRVTIREIILQ